MRDKALLVRITEEEAHIFKNAVTGRGLTLSAWARSILLRAAEEDRMRRTQTASFSVENACS